MMFTRLQAKTRGVLDGLWSPCDLTMGMSYDNADLNEMYDRGVNIGQALALARLSFVDMLIVLRVGGRVPPVPPKT